MSKKRKIGLTIYAIIIIVILIFIVFIAPDSLFSKNPPLDLSPDMKKEFVDYEEQKNNLKQNKYDYEFNIFDSMSDTTYIYQCKGTINEETETGSCTLPENLTYNSTNKKEKLKNINLDFIDPTFIFDLIKDIEPEIIKYQTDREYSYTLNIGDLETDILIRTNLNDITEIVLNNAYNQYHIKYSNINV